MDLGFTGYIHPRPLVLCIQGAQGGRSSKRGEGKIEPSFEACEILRKQFFGRLLDAFTPDYLVYCDQQASGYTFKVYELVLPQGAVTMIIVNAFLAGEYRLAHELVEALSDYCSHCYVLWSYPSEAITRLDTRYCHVHNGLLAVNDDVFEFSFAGLLREAGMKNVTEFSSPWAQEYAYAGCDAIAVSALIEELMNALGESAYMHNSHSSLVQLLHDHRERYVELI